MSFRDKTNPKLNQIINKNNEMRNIIYESVNNIEFLLKEFYKEQKRIKSEYKNNEENIDLSEIDNLSVSEQIELYKESISELQKETPEVKTNRIEIENINKQINELEKMNNNYSKIIRNINIESANLKQEEKETELKTLTEEYHHLREEYKNSLSLIKKQVKSIIILEDNCKFIGENIYFHKYNSQGSNKEGNEDFEEIKKMADDVQILKENLENKYENKIKKQKDEINKLKEFNSVLIDIIEEQKKNNKLDMINKAKSNYQQSINSTEDDK